MNGEMADSNQAASQQAGEGVEVPYQKLYVIGMGIEPNSGQSFAPALTHGEPDLTTDDKGVRTINEETRQISSEDEYSSAMKAAAHLSADSPVWSASAEVSAARETSASTSSLVYLSICKITTNRKLIPFDDSAVLSDPAKKLLTDKPVEFINQHGTHFIAGFILGGTYLSQVTITTQTAKQKDELKAKLEGSYSGIVSVKGGADFEAARSSSSVHSSVHISQYSTGSLTGEVPSMDNIYTNAEEFRSSFAVADKDGNVPEGKTMGDPVIALCYPWGFLKDVQAINPSLPGQNNKTVQFISSKMFLLHYYKAMAGSVNKEANYVSEAERLFFQAMAESIRGKISSLSAIPPGDLSKPESDFNPADFTITDEDISKLTKYSNGVHTVTAEIHLDPTCHPDPSGPVTLEISPQLSPGGSGIVLHECYKGWGGSEKGGAWGWFQRWVFALQYAPVNDAGDFDELAPYRLRAMQFIWPHPDENSPPVEGPPEIVLFPGSEVPPGYNPEDINAGNWILPKAGTESRSICSWAEKSYLDLKWSN